MSEPNELTDGYDPADPPEGNRWCAECAHWDDECECTYCDICGGRCEPGREDFQVCLMCDIEYMAKRQLAFPSILQSAEDERRTTLNCP